MLHEEINAADTRNYQIMTIFVGGSLLILANGFAEKVLFNKLLIFLAIYGVTTIAYRLLRGNRLRIWRASTYIRVFIEPILYEAKWESRLSALNRVATQKQKRDIFSQMTKTEPVLVLIINSTALCAALFSFFGLYGWNHQYISESIILLVIVVLFVAITFFTFRDERRMRRGGTIEENLVKQWEEIKCSEHNRNKYVP